MGEESTPPPEMEPTEKKVRQGVWGDTTTTVLPEAYELLEEDPEADSTPGRLDPQPTNEELVDKAKASDEISLIMTSPVLFLQEREIGLRGQMAYQASSCSEAWWPTWRFLS